MTPAREPALPLGAREEAGAFTVEEAAVVRAAFEALRSGVHPGIDDLARHCGLAPEAVAEIVGVFVRTGRAECDGGGRLTGIVGLTTEATRHRIILEGLSLFTWCAFDAVGIPAALEVDAAVFTTCGYCQGPMEVDLVAGVVLQPSSIRGWLPVKENCGNVKADFCPDANLFCNGEHLGTWRAEAGMPEGLVMDLDALSNLGRRSWGPCA
jgi:alkylmercury lyase